MTPSYALKYELEFLLKKLEGEKEAYFMDPNFPYKVYVNDLEVLSKDKEKINMQKRVIISRFLHNDYGLNDVKAAKYLKILVNTKLLADDDTVFLLGLTYLEGIGRKKNYKKALEQFKKIEKTSAFAQHALGTLYLHGLGVQQDVKQAWELLTTAAKNNHPIAVYKCASLKLCDKDFGANDFSILWQNDELRAREWQGCIQAARHGHGYMEAYLIISEPPKVYNAWHPSVPRNREGRLEHCQARKTLSYYQKLAEIGVSEAQYRMGRIAEQGLSLLGYLKSEVDENDKYNGDLEIYTAPDAQAAKQWYKLSADQGNFLAMMALGECLMKEGRKKEAVKCWEKAANLGYPVAQNKLGEMYFEAAQKSDPVKNKNKAILWFTKAIEQNYAVKHCYLKELQLDSKAILNKSQPVATGETDPGDKKTQQESTAIVDKKLKQDNALRYNVDFKQGDEESQLQRAIEESKKEFEIAEQAKKAIAKPESLSRALAPKPDSTTSNHSAGDQKHSAEKMWELSEALKSASTTNSGYRLISTRDNPRARKEIDIVVKAFQRAPVMGYDIASIDIIDCPHLEAMFRFQLPALQARSNNVNFAPKWNKENQAEWRGKVNDVILEMSRPYRDSEYPAVKMLPLFHGTNGDQAIIDSICMTGLANLAKTDAGFFGKGIYGAYEAGYAYKYSSLNNNGFLILFWSAFFSAYPVIDSDMRKLEGGASYENYDAHVAPVRRDNPSDLNTMQYYACKPMQEPECTEVVLFERAQTLPRCVIRLQPNLPKSPGLPSIEGSNRQNRHQLYAFMMKRSAATNQNNPAANNRVSDNTDKDKPKHIVAKE